MNVENNGPPAFSLSHNPQSANNGIFSGSVPANAFKDARMHTLVAYLLQQGYDQPSAERMAYHLITSGQAQYLPRAGGKTKRRRGTRRSKTNRKNNRR